MNKQVRVYQPGLPSAMIVESAAPLPAPGAGQVRLRHEAIGVNFVDTLFRSGAYALPLPIRMGVEGAGVVEELGPGVEELAVGDRVAYFFAFGAYASERLIDASQVVKLPGHLGSLEAAATYTKGLTAWMMLKGAHQLRPGEAVLVHGAAGGVGSLVAQWAGALGAKVYATVGSPSKAGLVRALGIEHVLDANAPDLAAQVRALNGGVGVDVVYELIGKATFAQSLAALRDGGHLVHVGNASGSPLVDKPALAARGIRYVQPSTGQYVGERASLERASRELFEVLGRGEVSALGATTYPLAEVARAHEDIAARRLAGAAVLLP